MSNIYSSNAKPHIFSVDGEELPANKILDQSSVYGANSSSNSTDIAQGINSLNYSQNISRDEHLFKDRVSLKSLDPGIDFIGIYEDLEYVELFYTDDTVLKYLRKGELVASNLGIVSKIRKFTEVETGHELFCLEDESDTLCSEGGTDLVTEDSNSVGVLVRLDIKYSDRALYFDETMDHLLFKISNSSYKNTNVSGYNNVGLETRAGQPVSSIQPLSTVRSTQTNALIRAGNLPANENKTPEEKQITVFSIGNDNAAGKNSTVTFYNG